jgi:hypothetical protein
MVFDQVLRRDAHARPIGIATTSSDRNGLSLRAVSRICSAMAAAMMRNVAIQQLPGSE